MAAEEQKEQERGVSDQDQQLQKLFEEAHRDPQLKRRLLANPEEVAREWSVKLGDREVVRLKKLGAFAELANEVKAGALFRHCNPQVCYPSTVWLKNEVLELIGELIAFNPGKIKDWGPIFYPAEIFSKFALEDRLDKKLGLQRRLIR